MQACAGFSPRLERSSENVGRAVWGEPDHFATLALKQQPPRAQLHSSCFTSVAVSMRKLAARSPSSDEPSQPAHLWIQAHEANLIRNHDALAQSVEWSNTNQENTRLVRWQAEDSRSWLNPDEQDGAQEEIWVDR